MGRETDPLLLRVDRYNKGVHRFLKMFELYDVDCDGIAFVAEAYSSIEEAKSMLETALGYAETPEQAAKIQSYLVQVYDELLFL
jgi:hypothetical protein